jgi:hypothetical protein
MATDDGPSKHIRTALLSALAGVLFLIVAALGGVGALPGKMALVAGVLYLIIGARQAWKDRAP